jgi:hypothetical protein
LEFINASCLSAQLVRAVKAGFKGFQRDARGGYLSVDVRLMAVSHHHAHIDKACAIALIKRALYALLHLLI